MSGEFRSFIAPTRVLYGSGAVSELTEQIRPLTPSRAVIVTSPSVAAAGWVDTVVDLLSIRSIPAVVFDGVAPNPRLETVREGLEKVGRQAGDVLLAVGGGGVMDTAKAMALQMSDPEDLAACAGFDRLPHPPLPVVVVPTTAGSGSEVSVWTVIGDSASRRKLIIGSPRLAPVRAICDPDLTASVPPDVTVHGGLDCLVHGMEAYVSRQAWAPVETLALEAISRVCQGLEDAFRDGADPDARGLLMEGSIMAGMALNNSGLGAAHALANAIGGLCDAPHGLINAVLAPHVMEFNLPACTEKYAVTAAALGVETHGRTDTAAAQAAVDRVKGLVDRLGLGGAGLAGLGLREDDIPEVVEVAMKSGNIPLNPRPVEPDDLADICRRAL